MITLTAEAINILKNLSQVDGALLAMRRDSITSVQESLDYSVEILTEKLK